jgi:hypothetical protein
MRGGVRGYAAQTIAPIDAEIGQKGPLWMGTSYYSRYRIRLAIEPYIVDPYALSIIFIKIKNAPALSC